MGVGLLGLEFGKVRNEYGRRGSYYNGHSKKAVMQLQNGRAGCRDVMVKHSRMDIKCVVWHGNLVVHRIIGQRQCSFCWIKVMGVKVIVIISKE